MAGASSMETVGRRSEEDDGQAFGANSARSARDSTGLRMIDRLRAVGLILAMFEENWFGVRMMPKQADEFGTAIAVEADNADFIFIHHSE